MLDPWLWPEGSYELGSPLPSFHPSIFPSGSFLGTGSMVFSETQHNVRGPCLVVRDRAGFLLKKIFARKMGKMGQKKGFLNLLENLVINFLWIWSIKKLYNICYILAQIMGMVKNGCGHSGLRTLKLAVSQERINRVSWFLVCW